MNIGTMGAAAILMRNNTNMMKGGGSGPQEQDDKPKGLGKLLLIVTVLVIGAWCFHVKPAFWYVEVEQQVVAKKMLQEEGSKGKVYNSCFIQVETGYVEQDNQWVKQDSCLWIHCSQQNYLNYNTGHVIKQQIVKPHLQGWSSAMTGIVLVLGLIWMLILAAIMANNL
jgi:hypothetical protein